MGCFFYNDCNERKTSWCHTNKAANKCGHAKKAFNNKCNKLYLHYMEELEKEENKLRKIEEDLFVISPLL